MIIPTYDAIIIGGGPAGSICARNLVASGINTLLLDRGNFPRVKLCGGWLSPPIWDVLGMLPEEYPHSLWKWENIHIHFRGKKYTVKSDGYFIRRYEFDDFLLKRSKVHTMEGYNVRQIEKDGEGNWLIDKQFKAKYVIGAGGTNCPVARSLFPKHEKHPYGTQEIEFEGNLEEIAACRAGKDGEPEILLHDDMKGYSWNVPKGQWLNVGSGTKIARDVLPAWSKAKAFFESEGTIPLSSRPMLEKMKGHGYAGFDSKYLMACQGENVFLVGDALGLAQPLTGEGILPAVLSGKICADAIIQGKPQSYSKLLRTHPVISDYRVYHAIQMWGKKIFKKRESDQIKQSAFRDKLIANVFARLFSGKAIPGSSLVARFRK